MSRLEHTIFFFTGKKSKSMLDIERRYPHAGKFERSSAFFHAFGNHGVDFNWGWIIILPASCNFEYNNYKEALHISTPLFALYYNKPTLPVKESVSK